ncbi:tumor necrosis factor receptor superfamily member 5-like isoform X2 [Scyliorhinus torazame]|uniref:tumor necrosis factor receptor superfamily member 5-like isoform X2 n=1 Tax=Scyliorhinus torazame TaxID=75743 RepID=UPI003B59DA26
MDQLAFLITSISIFTADVTGSVYSQSSCSDLEYRSETQCCRKCAAGSYVMRDCSPTAETLCVSCRQGEYMDVWNGLMNCLRCSDCDPDYGFKEWQSCTASQPRLCNCADGFYCEKRTDDGGCKSCKRRLICQTGEGTIITGSDMNQAVCKPCPEGFFSSRPSESPCDPWARCEELGMETVSAGSTVSDTECGPRANNSLLAIAMGLGAAVTCSCILLTFICICKHRGTQTISAVEGLSGPRE